MTRTSPSRHTVGAVALIVSLALAGCAATSPSPSASVAPSTLPTASAEPSVPASQPASAEPSVTATALPSDEPTGSLPPFACVPSVTITKTTNRAQITDVRVGTHDGYDRVTFEFAAGIPQTVIEGVLPPFFADASGLPLNVAGTAFLKVTMNGGTKVALNGAVTYAGSTNFEPGLDQLVQLREGGDFEAVSTWYLGLNSAGCYRVMTLASPSRLVIDIEH
ncbi:MAG: AMIN-like domain-containing (lipo)protein [Candidatus Limnocylindria bacterium]